MSEQQEGQDESPAVTVQAGLAAATSSVTGEPGEVPDLNWWPDGTEESDED